MNVSLESPEQATRRLRRVLATAQLQVLPGMYAFVEYPATALPAHEAPQALAFVRDDGGWSVLRPVQAGAAEPLAVFSFNFQPGLDNSGFVGWLASHLKATLGSGVLVVCGQNSARGGIFDYWGVPASVGATVVAEVRRLQAEAAASAT